MRIEQLYLNFGHGWRDAALDKFGMIPYTNPNKPVLFVGCYNHSQYGLIYNHAIVNKSPIVIWWAGGDAKSLVMSGYDNFWAHMFRSYPNIKHIAISHWIEEDLRFLDIPFTSLHPTIYDYKGWTPCPLGESVYMYNPDNTNYNGNGMYNEIKARLPYNFIKATWKTNDRETLREIYRNSFIGLRFTEHDGLSHTACEMGLMGRRMIHNGDLPNCIKHTDDVVTICDLITKEYETRKEMDFIRTGEEVFDFLNVGNDFLYTEYYEKGNKI